MQHQLLINGELVKGEGASLGDGDGRRIGIATVTKKSPLQIKYL